MPDQVLCINCGYDLRTLDHRGDCPECGTPVERSIHGDWLRYANEPYLRRLTRGLRWLTRCRAGIFWAFLSMIVLMIIAALVLRPNVDTPGETAINVLAGVAAVLMLLLFAVASVSLLFVARPDPARESSESKLVIAAPYVIATSIIGLTGLIAFAALPVEPMVKEIGLTACYLTAWAGITLMPMIALPIERRCAKASAARLRDLRQRTPRLVVIIGCLGLALYWIGPFRPMWSMPTADTRVNLLLFTVLGWIIAMGSFTTTRQAVEEEMREKPGDSGEGQTRSSR